MMPKERLGKRMYSSVDYAIKTKKWEAYHGRYDVRGERNELLLSPLGVQGPLEHEQFSPIAANT